jgi:hypothetical protein
MDIDAADRTAREYANRVAPAPKHPPIFVAVLSTVTAFVALAIFCLLAGLQYDTALEIPMILALGVVFIGAYGLTSYQNDKHSKVWAAEVIRLHRAKDS